jgi:outer membrane lipoprotein carrier protein
MATGKYWFRKMMSKDMFKKIVLGFLLLNATVAFAQTQAELVKPLQDYVDNLRTFSADFVQVQPDEETFQLNQSKGHFDLKRPGRLYWHYDEPEPQTIVIDGKNLWVYDESIDQVTVRSVDEIKGDIPLGWLLFDDPIAKKFDIIRSGEKNGLVWYNLAPKEATYFQSLDIGMQNGHMTDVIMYQNADNVTKVHFNNIIENREITDSYFHFVPPIGMDVVGTPQ